MARAKLDRIDRRIISDLQANGRMTNVELAERAGISAPPCLRRVRALERAGIIKGYHAELSPETLGYSVSVFALVGLNSQAEIDRLWTGLSEGGSTQQCGWLTDRFGVSWQIVPTVMPQLLNGPDPAGRTRAMRAMMTMTKLDIARLQAAYDGR